MGSSSLITALFLGFSVRVRKAGRKEGRKGLLGPGDAMMEGGRQVMNVGSDKELCGTL